MANGAKGMMAAEPSAATVQPVTTGNLDRIRDLYAAFGRGDVDAIAAALSPQVVWREAENLPYADGNPYVGPEAVLQGVCARIDNDWEGFRIEIAELIDAGDRVVMFGHYTAAYRKTGKTIRAEVGHIWTLADGKITAFQQLVDTLQIARAIEG